MKEWLFKTQKYVYKEVAKELNNMYGLQGSAPMAIGLFLNIPITVNLIQRDEVNYGDLTDCFAAYTKIDNEVEMFFDFFYTDEKSLSSLTKVIEDNSTFWAYVYQHELLHILFKHVTKSTHSRMIRIAKECKPGMDDGMASRYVNVAEDYFINYCIMDVVKNANSRGLSTLLEKGMYNSDYHDARLSDVEILRDVLESDSIKNKSLNNGYSIQTVRGKKGESGGSSITKDDSENGAGGEKEKKESGTLSDTELSDLATALNNIVQSSAKGSNSAKQLEEIFTSIKVNTDWFKKLKARFKRDVFYATNDYYTKWTSLNTKYRRLFKSPKKYFLDTKLEVVLSVDQSGSMPSDSLQKLLYLVESEGKRISKLTVIIHDSEVTQEFVLDDDYDITSNPNFKKALATRYQSGGTSHSDCFRWLQSNIKDPIKTIYMSFSDNYSDIEDSIRTYPIMRSITSYFVCPVNNPVRGVTNILME